MHPRPWSSIAIAAAAAAAPACRGNEPPPPQPQTSAPAHRVLGPATGGVRSLPPHAIRADGVGPYRVGRPLDEVLADLPLGLITLDIPGVVATSVVRAEDGGVLIDGESPGDANFVAVVRPDVARTESGIMVGSTKADLEAALGPALVDRRRPRDPRLWIGRAMPTARFLVEHDRVAAVMITRSGAKVTGTLATDAGAPASAGAAQDAGAAPSDASAPIDCGAPPIAAAVDAAAVKAGAPVTATAWCAGDDTALVAVASGDAIALIGPGADERPHRSGTIDAPGVVFVTAIADDDRDDLAVVTERGGDARVLSLTVYRWENGHAMRVAEQDLYRLTAASARWIGGRMEDIELLVELESRGDDVLAGGVMVSRIGGEIHDVAPLVPMTVARREREAPPDADATRTAPEDAHR
jgi:hypothetical protein